MAIIVSAHISDVHFGAFDSDILSRELKQNFLKVINKMPKLDVIFIQGDLYDHELSLNSKVSYNSFKFINELENIAYENDIKVRMIRGTKSHDVNQLKNLKFRKNIDFEIINSVTKEKLFKNLKVLYLPEEYMNNPDEFYKDYLNVEDDYYDFIIGHGLVTETAFNNLNSETQIKTAPVFDSKQLMRITKGPICFGHIHDGVSINNKIFYTGSFSRWCHGEENPKGFYFSIYNTKTGHFKIIPVVNKLARTFVTKKMTKYILNHDIQKIIDKIEYQLLIKHVDNLRIKVTEINDSDFLLKLDLLKKYFSGNNHISIEIKRLDISTRDVEEQKELVEKYEYLFDDNNSVEYQSTRFINEEFDYDISEEKVYEILNTDILKTINNKIYGGE